MIIISNTNDGITTSLAISSNSVNSVTSAVIPMRSIIVNTPNSNRCSSMLIRKGMTDLAYKE